MTLKRYSMDGGLGHNEGQVFENESANGEWVRYKDAEEAIAEAVAAERERWKERAIAACNSAGDGPDNGCCPTYWEEAREACIAAIQKA